jgi:hypothetical protein
MPSHLVAFMMRHAVGVVLAAVLAEVLAQRYTATQLAFDNNRLDLVSAGERYKAPHAAFSREFEELPGDMVVVIQSRTLGGRRHSAPHWPSGGRGTHTLKGSSTGSTSTP